MTLLQNVPVMEISSTQVRERLANNQSITELVDPEIELYIRKNHLYHQTQ
jgi:nicotinic acid mononucleotide adenylyltransferase